MEQDCFRGASTNFAHINKTGHTGTRTKKKQIMEAIWQQD